MLSPQAQEFSFASLVAELGGGELGVSSLSSDATAASAQLLVSEMR